MIQEFYTLEITTTGQKLYEFTDKTTNWINKLNFKNGILNLKLIVDQHLFLVWVLLLNLIVLLEQPLQI